MGSVPQGDGHQRPDAAQQRSRAPGDPDLQVRPRERRRHAHGAGEVQPLPAGSAGHAAGQPDHRLLDHRGPALLRRRRGTQFPDSEPGRAHLRSGRKLSGAGLRHVHRWRRRRQRGGDHQRRTRLHPGLPASARSAHLDPGAQIHRHQVGARRAEDLRHQQAPLSGQLHAAQGDDPGGGHRRDHPQRHSRLGGRRRRPARPQSGSGHPRGQPGGDHLPGGRGLAAVGQPCRLARFRQRTGHRHHLHGALDLHQADGQGHRLRGQRLVRTGQPSGGRKLLLSGDRLQRHRRDGLQRRCGRRPGHRRRGDEQALLAAGQRRDRLSRLPGRHQRRTHRLQATDGTGQRGALLRRRRCRGDRHSFASRHQHGRTHHVAGAARAGQPQRDQLRARQPRRPAGERLQLQPGLRLLPRPSRHRLRHHNRNQTAGRGSGRFPEAAHRAGKRPGAVQHRLPAQLHRHGDPQLRPDPHHHGPDPRHHSGRRGPEVQRCPVPDEQRAAEPGRPDQERHLLGRLLEHRPVGHLPRRMGRPGQRDRPFRRAGPHSALHRALGRSGGQQRQLLRQPGAAAGQRDRAGGAERLVRGAQHQPLRGVRQAPGHAADHAQPRAARPDRHRRHRHQLHPEQVRHRAALRRPGDGQQPDQRRGRSGQRLLHHSDQRPQRQPHRGDGRRRLLGPGQPADQRSAGHYPHRAHHREPHHPRARGAGGLAHPDHLRAP